MNALSILFQKIAAVITALFIPLATFTPATVNRSSTPYYQLSSYASYEQAEETPEEIVLDEEENGAGEERKAAEANQIKEDGENAEDEGNEAGEVGGQNAAENGAVLVGEEGEGEEFVSEKTWDISAEENGELKMDFYNTDDIAALVEQLTGKLAAVFMPMTVYAAEEKADVDFYPDEVQPISDEGGAQAKQTGALVITGSGPMVEDVYMKLITAESFVSAAEAAMREYYKVPVKCIYDETIEDPMEIDATCSYRVVNEDGTYGEYVYINDGVRAALTPEAMLQYIPHTILFLDEGLTEISDNAFMFCSYVTEVEIPDTVERIGANAFAYCDGLTEIVIPASVKEIGDGAFMQCDNLRDIRILTPAAVLGFEAFANLPADAQIYCSSYIAEYLDEYTCTLNPENIHVINVL